MKHRHAGWDIEKGECALQGRSSSVMTLFLFYLSCTCSVNDERIKPLASQAKAKGSLWGILLQSLGVTRASNPSAPR